jgi:hypothetical protein
MVDMSAFASAAAASASAHPRRPTPMPKKGSGLKAIAVPIMGTVGVLLLVPATWALLYLFSVQVPGFDRPSARPMAFMMMMCWPIAIILIAGAVVMFRQVMREKAKA